MFLVLPADSVVFHSWLCSNGAIWSKLKITAKVIMFFLWTIRCNNNNCAILVLAYEFIINLSACDLEYKKTAILFHLLILAFAHNRLEVGKIQQSDVFNYTNSFYRLFPFDGHLKKTRNIFPDKHISKRKTTDSSENK